MSKTHLQASKRALALMRTVPAPMPVPGPDGV